MKGIVTPTSVSPSSKPSPSLLTSSSLALSLQSQQIISPPGKSDPNVLQLFVEGLLWLADDTLQIYTRKKKFWQNAVSKNLPFIVAYAHHFYADNVIADDLPPNSVNRELRFTHPLPENLARTLTRSDWKGDNTGIIINSKIMPPP